MKQTAKIKMFKKIPCPFCERAANFFQGKGLQVEIVDLTNNMGELQKLKTETGWATVPMIFINDKLIGGYNDLKALDDDGKLDAMVMG